MRPSPRDVEPSPLSAAVVQAMAAPAALEDGTRQVVALNAALCQLLCLGPDADTADAAPHSLEGLLRDAHHLFDSPDTLDDTVAALRVGDSDESPSRTASLAMTDGRTLRLSYTPFAHEPGGLWQFEDVTVTQQAEEARQAAQRLAAQADAVRRDFITVMSHEIRTPMNAVVGMAHLLAETDLDEGQQELVTALRRSTDHLLDLLNDVLDFSRLETGGTTFAAEPFDLRATLDGLAERYAPRADETALAFDVEVDEAVPPSVIGDEERLLQVLTNLLDNAFIFTHEGGVQVQVTCERLRGGRAFLRIDVADTGIGIDPAQQAQLFDPLAHVRAAASAGRTGLGLAIVQQIVKQQGGTISLASAVGVGSVFTVRLSFATDAASDFRQAPTTAEAVARPDAPLVEASDSVLRGCHLLIVDDHPLNRMLAERLLTQWGATAETAEHGGAALDRLRDAERARFDLVLMDIQMPVLGGLEATRAIRAMPPPVGTTPVLALTAATGTDEREAVFAAGLDDYVSKPFVPAHLLARIVAHLKPGTVSTPSAVADDRSLHPSVSTEPPLAALPTPEDVLAELDLDLLDVHALGDADFAQHLLQTFVSQTERAAKGLRGAQAEEDWATVRLLAHKVRPSLRMVGLDRLEAVASSLDEEAYTLAEDASATPADDFGTRIDVLVACCETVCAHLRAEAVVPD
ncbi:MAG: response regulator [Bacteroidota bacterium]